MGNPNKHADDKAIQYVEHCQRERKSPIESLNTLTEISWCDVKHFARLRILQGGSLDMPTTQSCRGGCGRTFLTNERHYMCMTCTKMRSGR